MKPPSPELLARFEAFTPKRRETVIALLEDGLGMMEALGGTEHVWVDAWEACLEAVEQAEGDLR